MFNNTGQSGMYEHPIRPKLASSVSSQNSDDDADTSNISIRRDRRRELHTQAEQRRRDAIKSGYEALLPLCHPTSPDNGSSKLSKATILQRAISQIKSLSEHTSQKEKELENLKNELFALRIMNSNYEEMAKGNKSQMKTEEISEVPESVKFEIFGQFMQALFLSFDKGTKFDNFSTASSTIIHWVEEYCKPQNLNLLVESVLTEVLSEYHGGQQQQCLMPGEAAAPVGDCKMEQDLCWGRPANKGEPGRHSVPLYEARDPPRRQSAPGRRQTMPALPAPHPPHPHTQTQTQACIDLQIDDDLMAMSPNAIDLSFLDSLDQENFIDDIWMPSEKSEF